MYEIAKGMEYLHSNGVLHGDLKAANVLVDNKFRCVISDFGLSEMKSEAYRISGTAPPRQFLLSHESLMLTSNFRRNASVAIPRAHVWSKPADSRGRRVGVLNMLRGDLDDGSNAMVSDG